MPVAGAEVAMAAARGLKSAATGRKIVTEGAKGLKNSLLVEGSLGTAAAGEGAASAVEESFGTATAVKRAASVAASCVDNAAKRPTMEPIPSAAADWASEIGTPGAAMPNSRAEVAGERREEKKCSQDRLSAKNALKRARTPWKNN